MFYSKIKATKYRHLIKRLFPEYKGRTFILTEARCTRISDYWSEGHRAYPRLFNPQTGLPLALSVSQHPAFRQQTQNNPFNQIMGDLDLSPDLGLIEHVYSGTRQHIRIVLHPDTPKEDWIS